MGPSVITPGRDGPLLDPTFNPSSSSACATPPTGGGGGSLIGKRNMTSRLNLRGKHADKENKEKEARGEIIFSYFSLLIFHSTSWYLCLYLLFLSSFLSLSLFAFLTFFCFVLFHFIFLPLHLSRLPASALFFSSTKTLQYSPAPQQV